MNKLFKNINLAIATGAVSLLFAVPAFAGYSTIDGPGSMPMGSSAQYSASDKTVVVTGWGKTQARVDKATLSFTLQTDAKSAKEANQNINKAMDEVVSKLAKFGVKKEDLVTTWWNFYPQLDYSVNATGTVSGFMAERSISVTLNDNIANVDEAMSTLLEVTVVRITNMNFATGIKDAAPYMVMAKEAAFNDAKDKAAGLVKLLGLNLDSVIKVEDFSYNNNYYTSQNMNTVDVETSLNVTFKVK
jgi:uncharacterized protein YggE